MDILLILTYTAICIAIFKVFKVPLNKWTVPTAVFGGIVLIGGLIIFMNYNHPYAESARKYTLTTPMVPAVSGIVTEVPVQPNEMLEAGDVLFRVDPTPYQASVDSLTARLNAAKLDLSRAEQLLQRNAGNRRDRDLAQAQVQELEANLREAQFHLDQTVVRAPTRGYVTQVILRPGMMAVQLPLKPVMVFVHDEEDLFVGWFQQNSLLRLEEQAEAEITFDGIPGEVFSAEVVDSYPALASGQLQPTGVLQEDQHGAGMVPVRLRITDGDFMHYRDQLPGGAYGQAAIYGHQFHHLSVIRKVFLRMNAWLDYLFPFH